MALSTKLFLLVLPLFASCAAVPVPALAPQYYAQYEVKMLVDVGQRKMDSAFDPVDDQTTLGLELYVYQPNSRSGFELGFLYSAADDSEDAVDYEADGYEFSMGGRLYFEPVFNRVFPYFSGGVTSQYLKRKELPDAGGNSKDVEWAAFAPYLRGGMEWRTGTPLSLALEYRIVLLANLFYDIDIGDSEADGNYQQLALVLGWDF